VSEGHACKDAHAASTGCRTLDALHVACARVLSIREFVTTDERQTALARHAGMRVTNPARCRCPACKRV